MKKKTFLSITIGLLAIGLIMVSCRSPTVEPEKASPQEVIQKLFQGSPIDIDEKLERYCKECNCEREVKFMDTCIYWQKGEPHGRSVSISMEESKQIGVFVAPMRSSVKSIKLDGHRFDIMTPWIEKPFKTIKACKCIDDKYQEVKNDNYKIVLFSTDFIQQINKLHYYAYIYIPQKYLSRHRREDSINATENAVRSVGVFAEFAHALPLKEIPSKLKICIFYENPNLAYLPVTKPGERDSLNNLHNNLVRNQKNAVLCYEVYR